MTKTPPFYIEKVHGKFELCREGADGVTEVHGVFNTLEEAEADIEAAQASENAERWYAMQIDRALGYSE